MSTVTRFFVAVATIAFIVNTVTAKNITVGAPGGSWDLTTKLTTWASSQTFAVGDNLIFNYDSTKHDVLEVSKADYDSCTTGGPINTYKTGNDVISLPKAETRYFICGTPGHCSQGGMKITVAVGSPSAPSPSPPGTTPTPATPDSPPPPVMTPPPSAANSLISVHAFTAVGIVLFFAL